jgi:S1-C subfamily serine protease
MTGLDWIIVAALAFLGLFGFHRGFIVGALSFFGFVGGAFIGTRLGPLLLPEGASSPYAPAFGLIGALLAGAILATGLEGVGVRLRRVLVLPGLNAFDGLLGGLLAVGIGLGVVWIAAAVIAQAPGTSSLRNAIQRSAILQALNATLPPSGPILDALARLDPLPHITGPSTRGLAPPEPALAHSPSVRAADRSVVRVLGTACGLAIEGSGWVAREGLVVTNAHVVAGETDTVVEENGNPPELPAQVVAFDKEADIALLRVSELHAPSLHLAASTPSGTAGVILGYPEDGPFEAQAARIGETQNVITQNAYGEGPVTRLLTPLRGLVRPGNSGGPVVDAEGDVLTTVFAGTTGGGPHGGYGVANSTVTQILAGPEHLIGVTPCDS